MQYAVCAAAVCVHITLVYIAAFRYGIAPRVDFKNLVFCVITLERICINCTESSI